MSVVGVECSGVGVPAGCRVAYALLGDMKSLVVTRPVLRAGAVSVTVALGRGVSGHAWL